MLGKSLTSTPRCMLRFSYDRSSVSDSPSKNYGFCAHLNVGGNIEVPGYKKPQSHNLFH